MPDIAVIIARAGSKGLPDKAMQKVAGKPSVAWTLEHARASRRVDDLALSSDSPAVLAVGKAYAARCYPRPAHLASDTATVDDAVRHAVQAWENQFGAQADRIAILYGNIPIRPADLTDRALARLAESGADSVQSVASVGKMHPLWMKTLGGDAGDTLHMYQENRIYRRQDLPPVYMLDAGVLAVTRKALFTVIPHEPHAFLGKDRRAVITRPGDVVDVDTELDLAFAELLLSRQRAILAPATRRSAAG